MLIHVFWTVFLYCNIFMFDKCVDLLCTNQFLICSLLSVEVEGYGPYKPVPPPKPLPQQALQSQELQQLDCFTPPPYRMPPYPLFNEPNIPGAAGLDHPIASSSPATPQGLHTHSSKFPVSTKVHKSQFGLFASNSIMVVSFM